MEKLLPAVENAEFLPEYEKIVDFAEIDRTISDKETGEPIYVDTVVRYTYIEEPITDKEIINSSTEKINDTTFRVYAGQAFIQDLDSNWYELKSDVMSQTLFDSVQTEMLTERSSFLHATYVNAQETVYSESEDGFGRTAPGTWAAARSATDADNSFNKVADTHYLQAHYNGSIYPLSRFYFPFDTSGLSSYDFDSVSMFIWTNDKEETNNADIYVVDADQINNSFDSTDFDYITDTDYGSVTFENIASAGYTEIELDPATVPIIDGVTDLGLRIGCDQVNTQPTGQNIVNDIKTSEYTGTDHDPYLEITITVEEPPVATTTPETVNNVIVDMPYTQELTMITAMAVTYGTTTGTTTPLSVTYTYYHLPIIAWLIVIYVLGSAFWFIYSKVVKK